MSCKVSIILHEYECEVTLCCSSICLLYNISLPGHLILFADNTLLSWMVLVLYRNTYCTFGND